MFAVGRCDGGTVGFSRAKTEKFLIQKRFFLFVFCCQADKDIFKQFASAASSKSPWPYNGPRIKASCKEISFSSILIKPGTLAGFQLKF